MAVLIHKRSKNPTMLISQYLKDPYRFQGLLHEWFEERDINGFVKIHPIQHNTLSQEILQQHYIWSKKLYITTTPTTYLNNKKLSEKYTIEQLTAILDMSYNPKHGLAKIKMNPIYSNNPKM